MYHTKNPNRPKSLEPDVEYEEIVKSEAVYDESSSTRNVTLYPQQDPLRPVSRGLLACSFEHRPL